MANWIRVAQVADCPEGTGREVVADGQIVALFHLDGQFHALDGSCPHQAGPLGKGQLDGCTVTCPRHGLRVDVKTGEYQISTPQRQPRYAVKVEGGDVFVDIASPGIEPPGTV